MSVVPMQTDDDVAPVTGKPAATALTSLLLRDLRGSLPMRSLWVFCTCLFLGISLIAACAGLLQLVRSGLDAQQRALFGGDLQVSARAALEPAELDWLQANGEVSRLLELRTMLGAADGEFTVVELQSVDDNYPLYGEMVLQPLQPIAEAVAKDDNGVWGAAFDPVLAEQLDVKVGDRVSVGSLEVELRALIITQPDRSFRADWSGPPVLIDANALADSELIQPGSLVDYEYRVRTTEEPAAWRQSLSEAFPEATWEVQTVDERGEIVTEQLDRVASVLLLIGFSTLLIGGLGVSNSIGAYLQSKFRTLATLQSIGARQAQISYVFIGQCVLLALVASTAGALAGSSVSWLASLALSERLPVDTRLVSLIAPTLLAILFGVVSALAFALPVLGRTLDMRPAILIRGASETTGNLPLNYKLATLGLFILAIVMLLVIVPEPGIAVAFVVAVILLMAALEGLVRLIRTLAVRLGKHSWFDGRFAARMALAGLHRPGTALRPLLLSLGTALTLLVASALVIAATVQSLNTTVPSRAPALVFYDIQDPELADFETTVRKLDGFEQVLTTPLVLGRLRAVNGEPLSNREDARQALEANDEQKFSTRTEGIDNIKADRGAWWPKDYQGPPLVGMEDREADQAGLKVGDRLGFEILGERFQAELAVIYEQARFETRFWFEAIFTDGVLDPFVTRHVGSAFLRTGTDVAATAQLGKAFPSVVTLRTAKALNAAREILTSASLAVLLIAAVSLAASVLVMASVVAVNRQRQVYEASVLQAIGTRLGVVMRSVLYEYALLGAVLALFATAVGSLLGGLILHFWLELPADGIWFVGLLVAAGASGLCLASGAWWLMRTLDASPASLLRRAG